MISETTEKTPFQYRLPLYGLAAASCIVFPLALHGTDDEELGIILLVVPLLSLVLLIVAAFNRRRQLPAVLSMLIVYVAIAWPALLHGKQLSDKTRWTLWSKEYEAQVLAQEVPKDGNLQHIEWDGWGFPGAGNTTVYLVFDPQDSLAVPSGLHNPGRVPGIPCEVPEIRRLEARWYKVLFYTETDWKDCSPNG